MAGEIFISYRRSDEARARLLHDLLKERGVEAWYDRHVAAGDDWRSATANALVKAPIFVLLFSKNASQSDDIIKELSAATFQKKVVIPVRIEDIHPEGAFLYELASRNWFDAFNDTEARLAVLADQLAALVKGGSEAQSAANKLGAQQAGQTAAATKSKKQRSIVVLGVAAVAAAALVSIAAMPFLWPKSEPTSVLAQSQRTAFFGFTAGSSDPLASEIATNATEETFAALGVLQIESAARGQTQGVALTGQLDKAAALGARYALGGDVRASGDEVTVNIRLDDVGSITTLWQETLTGGAAERESLPVLAAGLASTLLECLISVRPDMLREDASALALVTRACQFSNINDRQYVALWRDAEQVAPNSLTVHRRIARGWNNQSTSASDAERPAMLQEARAALQRQLAIRPTYQQAAATLAIIDIASDRPLADIIAAMNAAFQEADASGDRMGMDNSAILRMRAFSTMGRNAEAARLGRSDAAAFPLSSWVLNVYGNVLWSAGQTLEARAVLDSVVRRLASVDAWSIRAGMAIADGEDIAPILAAAPPAASVELVACWQDVARAARATNASVRATGASRLLGCVRAGNIASSHAIVTLNVLGQVDAAYTITGPLLKRSNPFGLLNSGTYMFAPMARPMRADQRFLPLMRETGIYQYWLDTKTQPDMCETPEEREFEVCVALRKDQGK